MDEIDAYLYEFVMKYKSLELNEWMHTVKMGRRAHSAGTTL